MAKKSQHADGDPAPADVAESGVPVWRDRSIDVLRGATSVAMVLVNTAGPVRPSWLAHAGALDAPITFADTLFPCFVFTAGLAAASAQSNRSERETSELRKALDLGLVFERTLVRAIKLNLLGIAYNNLIPRLIGRDQAGILDFKTYRIPSVLGRIGISSIVCALEYILDIKPPILPALLGLSWYMVSRLRPLSPLHASSQAWLDQALFGPSHLHQPVPGFDPEGMLASLLTVPISELLGGYLARPLQNLITTIGTPELVALGVLGSLLTGLLPSPASKLLWTPTFVGQTTATSLLYWAFSKALVSVPRRLPLCICSALEMLGQRSLEVYLISASASFALDKLGAWDSVAHLISGLLIQFGFRDDHNRNLLVGLARSSLLGVSMVPVAEFLIRSGWKI